ncbi:undecaprenyl-diphosphate phosphatase [Flavisolibacter nicotianae]|uniref:undecaprenyl-diphosphate phosphatase n=1 Tax=Flavisolibacter nicotianae TaxID=2364882 RepID=UPI000EB3F243|nr:undecaprenyl-diphosphate phosphatase [Flavisolibacter nicotianae]
MNLFQAIVIAIVEGITEFLPISSTGHMIITSSLMGIEKEAFTKMFEVVIQLGAILSVVVLYYKKFFDFSRWQFYIKLIVAVIPALVFGALFSKKIKALMESNLTVAISLLVGGVVLLFIDNVFRNPKYEKDSDITYPRAFTIGLWQVLAMVPGVSRSAASIIGGMQQGLTRKLAAEFSFFLAVPTMFAATAKDLYDWYKDKGSFSSEEIKLLAVGNVVAFVVALLAIKFFISYLQKHGFKLFGWYRIVAGVLLLALIFAGRLS